MMQPGGMKYLLLFIAAFAWQFACARFAEWFCDWMEGRK